MAKQHLEQVNRSLRSQRKHPNAVLSLLGRRSSLVGHLVGCVLVILTTLTILLVRPPHVVWVPYCLAFVIVGWLVDVVSGSILEGVSIVHSGPEQFRKENQPSSSEG